MPVNRNIITKAPRPASLQEESCLTPSHPTPLKRRNETTRTKRDVMRLLSPQSLIVGRHHRYYESGGRRVHDPYALSFRFAEYNLWRVRDELPGLPTHIEPPSAKGLSEISYGSKTLSNDIR